MDKNTKLNEKIFNELNYIKETPTKVVINESLEIAKKYGAQDSKNFINGILDSVAKAAHGEIGRAHV